MRPLELDGALALFGLVKGTTEAALLAALEPFGKIVSCEVGKGRSPTVLRFATHRAALAAKKAAARLQSICASVDTL